MLVVACNTATAVALPMLERRYDVPVLVVVRPGARAATSSQSHGKIGVIGTAVTISSGAYTRAVKAVDNTVEVHSLACPAFVPLVERGSWSGDEVEMVVQRTLTPLIEQSVNTLILGCTHYPLLQETIQKVMGNQVTLISSAEETAREVKAVLTSKGQLNSLPRSESLRNRYFTSGDGTRLRAALEDWFRIFPAEDDVVSVNLDTLTHSTDITDFRSSLG